MRVFMRWGVCLVLITALLSVVPRARAEDTSARDLVKRMLDNVPKNPFTARVTLASDRGWERQLELKHKRVNGIDSTYMEVISPQDVADTRFLFYEKPDAPDEQYIKVPSVPRAIRVSDDARKQQFLGSTFYVSDLVAPTLDDYNYTFVGEKEVDGKATKMVQSTPKKMQGELYSKTVSYIDPQNLVALRTDFYDLQGKLLKVWSTSKLEKIDDVLTPMVQQMKNVRDDTTSTLKIDDVKFNADLDDMTFTRAHLVR